MSKELAKAKRGTVLTFRCLRRAQLLLQTALALAAISLIACGAAAPLEAPRVPVGLYVLKSFDDQQLPLVLEDRGVIVTDGVLALSPRRSDARPLYALIVSGRSTLDSNARAERFFSDAGFWDDSSSSPRLLSRDGVATGELGRDEVGVLAGGHRYVFAFARAPEVPMLPLTVSAVDGAKQIDGAVFEMAQSDGVVERIATSNGLPHLTEAVAGPLQVRVIPPVGYRLVAGQANPSTYSLAPAIPLNIVVAIEPLP